MNNKQKIIEEFKKKFKWMHTTGIYIDDEFPQLESFLSQALDEYGKICEERGWQKGYEEGEKFANRIESAMPELDKLNNLASEIIDKLKSETQ